MTLVAGDYDRRAGTEIVAVSVTFISASEHADPLQSRIANPACGNAP